MFNINLPKPAADTTVAIMSNANVIGELIIFNKYQHTSDTIIQNVGVITSNSPVPAETQLLLVVKMRNSKGLFKRVGIARITDAVKLAEVTEQINGNKVQLEIVLPCKPSTVEF